MDIIWICKRWIKKEHIIDFYNLKLDAFDSFEGLSEDRKFTKDPKGSYTNSKKIPILNKNVKFSLSDFRIMCW